MHSFTTCMEQSYLNVQASALYMFSSATRVDKTRAAPQLALCNMNGKAEEYLGCSKVHY